MEYELALHLHKQDKVFLLPIFVARKEKGTVIPFNNYGMVFPDEIHQGGLRQNIRKSMNSIEGLQCNQDADLTLIHNIMTYLEKTLARFALLDQKYNSDFTCALFSIGKCRMCNYG